MKKITFAALLCIATTAIAAVSIWKVDKSHSQLAFTIRHLGVVDLLGTINDYEVSIQSETDDLNDAVVTLVAKVASIDTRSEGRDRHLQAPDYFDAAQFPEIKFVSTKLVANGENQYQMTGDLTIKGVTKSVNLDLLRTGDTEHPRSKKPIMGVQVVGEIKRSDFGIGPDSPNAVISDIVKIQAAGEFSK